MNFFSSLSSLGFLNLGFLAAGLLLPLVVFAYFRRKRQNTVAVSSLFFFSQLPKTPLRKKKLAPPLRFLFEMLLLSLLVLAASGVFMRKPSKHLGVLLDTSLSMAAEEQGMSRLEQAKQKIKNQIADSSFDFFTLVVSAPEAITVLDTGTKSQFLEQLAKVEVSPSSDLLTASLLEMQKKREFSSLLLVSDRSSSSAQDFAENVSYLNLGAANENAFFEEVSVSSPSPKKAILEGVIGFSGEGTLPVRLAVFKLSSLEAQPRLLQRKTLELKASETNRFQIETDGRSKNDLYKLEIQFPNASAKNRNSIKNDDIAWLSEEKSSNSKVLLVSKSSKIKKSGLEKIPGLSIKQLTLADFNAGSKESSNYDAIVFNKVSPTKIPSVPSLTILGDNNTNASFSIKEVAENATLTSWREGDSLLRYLNVLLLDFTRVAITNSPNWMRAVLRVEKGAVLTAGEYGGIRHVHSGLSILPYEGSKTPVSSILTLNVLRWLSKSLLAGESFSSGGLFRLEAGQNWYIREPAGSLFSKTVPENSIEFYRFKQPGPYLLSNISSKATDSKQAKKRLITVNTVTPIESKTFEAHPLTLLEQEEADFQENEEEAQDSLLAIWRYLLWFILVVALLDAFFFSGRKIAKNKAQAKKVDKTSSLAEAA